MNNTSEEYWGEYDGLQYAKHELLKHYLGGWFPILSSWKGRIDYIDCHAGRGIHKTGHEGSPILAIRQLLEHKSRNRILQNTIVHFSFLENDHQNIDQLQQNIEKLGTLPRNIKLHFQHMNYETYLRQDVIQKYIDAGNHPPLFAFIDPFNYSIPMVLMNKILSLPATELLITFMFRYIDMAMTHENQSGNIDALYGGHSWQQIPNIDDYDLRFRQAMKLYSNQLNAKYVTHMRMYSKNNTIKYALIHATNHQKGRELIKDAMWKVSPDGSFRASEGRCPEQLILLEPKPDLQPLEESLLQKFSGSSVTMNELYDWLLDQLYRKPHLHTVIRKLRSNGMISATGYCGRFSFKSNPTISFPVVC